jgi:hypothetical protein
MKGEPYRTNSANPPARIVYAASSLGRRAAATVTWVLSAAVLVAMMVHYGLSATFDCSRGADTCTVTSTRPLLGSMTAVVAMSSIVGTSLERRTNQYGDESFAVTLVLSDGALRLSSEYAALGLRQSQQRAIDAFLASEATPTLHVDYDEASPLAFVPLALTLPLGWLVWRVWRRTIVVVDPGAQTLSVVLSRWPLPGAVFTLPLAEVVGVEVVHTPIKAGASYAVALRLRSGESVPLTGTKLDASIEYHLGKANEIRAALPGDHPLAA